MLLFRTVSYFYRWAKFCGKAIGTWHIDPGSNPTEMRANLANSVLRFDAAAFEVESNTLQAEWVKLFRLKK